MLTFFHRVTKKVKVFKFAGFRVGVSACSAVTAHTFYRRPRLDPQHSTSVISQEPVSLVSEGLMMWTSGHWSSLAHTPIKSKSLRKILKLKSTKQIKKSCIRLLKSGRYFFLFCFFTFSLLFFFFFFVDGACVEVEDNLGEEVLFLHHEGPGD